MDSDFCFDSKHINLCKTELKLLMIDVWSKTLILLSFLINYVVSISVFEKHSEANRKHLTNVSSV